MKNKIVEKFKKEIPELKDFDDDQIKLMIYDISLIIKKIIEDKDK